MYNLPDQNANIYLDNRTEIKLNMMTIPMTCWCD